jgi:hypothetical protein
MSAIPQGTDPSSAGEPTYVLLVEPGEHPGLSQPGSPSSDNQRQACPTLGDKETKEEAEEGISEWVQPAKVLRIASMVRQLLDEVRNTTLDEASRTRLREIHEQSIRELAGALSAELAKELERITLPFDQSAPSETELRVAQAQLVGWLEGLYHGIQASFFAQQVAAAAQLHELREPGLQRSSSVEHR